MISANLDPVLSRYLFQIHKLPWQSVQLKAELSMHIQGVCVYLSVIYPHDPCVQEMSVEHETHRASLSSEDQTELPSPLTSGLLFPALAAAEVIVPPFTPSLPLLAGQVGG